MVSSITKFIWKSFRVDNLKEDLSSRLPVESKFLSRSNMACVKSLMSAHCFSNYCTKPACLSVEKEFSKHQSNLSFTTKGLMPAFGYFNTVSSSTDLMKNLMEGSSHPDSLMKAVEDYLPGSSQKIKAMPVANMSSGLVAASAAVGKAAPTQQTCLFSSDSPVESWEDYLSDEENSIRFQEKKTQSLPILESSMPEDSCSRNSQDIVANLPVIKSSMINSSGSRESTCITSTDSCEGGNQGSLTSSSLMLSDSSILGGNIKQPYNMSADISECMPDSSHDSSHSYASCSSSGDSPKCERDVKSRTNNSEPCSFKPVINLASILSAPRKTAKKGRPSSKKQKKRQREKHKHESHSVSPAEKVEIPLKSTNWLEKRGNEAKSSPVLISSSCSRKNSERKSTSVKESTKFCPLSQLFFKPSHSEESNEENDDVTYAEKPVKQQWKVCISPVTDACFNFALNLDSIFKQKCIPSLKGIIDVQDFTSETSSPKFSTKKLHCHSSSFSDDESFDDVDCSYPLSPLEFSVCGLSNGLSLDILFTKKSPPEIPAAADPTFDQTDGQSLDCKSCQASTETDLKNVNARWEAAYPTAGYRSCQFTTEDEIKHPNIQVHFAREPYLATAHIVEWEDRAGTWHLFALDRERFERHIQEVSSVVTPVLQGSHRAKIQQRMQQPIICP